MTTPTAITLWLPALKKGAPTNRAGMAPGGPYRTRREALEHEHWSSQAAWATAQRVTVSDNGSMVDGFDGEELAHQVCEYDNTDRVAELLSVKRWASAIKAAMGWEWGALTVQNPEDTNCKKCRALLDAKGTDCAWCGGECERPYMNRRGEVFCSPNHRASSNRALRRLVGSEQEPDDYGAGIGEGHPR